MMMSKSINLQDLWNVLRDNQTSPGALGTHLRYGAGLCFYDEFRRGAADVEVWAAGGDDGSWTAGPIAGESTVWRLLTGVATDNDRYIYGLAALRNGVFNPAEFGHSMVNWEARLRLVSITLVSAFWGLVATFQGNYLEPAVDCAHFFADPVVSANFQARSYDGGVEEQTDTGVALDLVNHRFRICWTAASVLFYIDDVLVATHAVRVPDQSMGTEFLIRTEENAAKEMRIDYVRVETA